MIKYLIFLKKGKLQKGKVSNLKNQTIPKTHNNLKPIQNCNTIHITTGALENHEKRPLFPMLNCACQIFESQFALIFKINAHVNT